MEERKEKKKPDKPQFDWISKEELKARSGSLFTVLGVGIALWAAPFIISRAAAIIRSVKDLRKACNGQ